MDAQLLVDALQIVLIDLLLAGDNAVVIAMAVRSLPPRERRMGILAGSALAVVLRVGITFFAAQLLRASFIKFTGGLLILWIGWKLLADNVGGEDEGKEAAGLWQAMWIILVADITMSVDNILAVAAASKGHFGLLLFGLGLSIPFVVFTSDLLSRLMNRWPIIIFVGAAILGKVGGEMAVSDPWIVETFRPEPWMNWAAQATGALGIVGVRGLLNSAKAR
ncbi:MAG: TerC family protein [Acidobacteria bacterium]|nr:TerC family protein [Acidobacteriota bacterium]